MPQLLYGKNVVKQILQEPNKVHKVLLAVNDQEILVLAERHGIQIERCTKAQLSKWTKNERHQGVAVEVDDYKPYSLKELLDGIPQDKKGLIVMVDELEDPHNFGAILRTVDAVGADGVIFKKTNAVGLTPGVAKASAGAIDTVKCAAVTNLSRAIEELKENGWWIVGTDMGGSDYRLLDYDMNVVLVIGNEGKGMTRLVREKCDYIVSLPMVGQISSLNASVSAGVLLYEIYNKRFPV